MVLGAQDRNKDDLYLEYMERYSVILLRGNSVLGRLSVVALDGM